ncbi:MAG: hypothetical protein JW818_15300 [Pirellulales bacterium]|nr:hypothetical protein [Pirellulales bacterium]
MNENDRKPELSSTPASPSGKRHATPWDEPEGPPQFGLLGLLLFQAGFALFLALLMAVGIWAILPVFIATIGLRWGPWRLKNPAWRRLAFDLLAGVALPVLCLWYDPFVFRQGNDYRVLAYLFIALQIASLLAWKVFETATGRPNGVLGGILAVGALFALAVGFMILPFSLLGLLFGIGLLGLTPFMTAWAFGTNAVAALRPWPKDTFGLWRRVIGIGLGVGLAIGVPLLANGLHGDALDHGLSQMPVPDLFGTQCMHDLRVNPDWLSCTATLNARRSSTVSAARGLREDLGYPSRL